MRAVPLFGVTLAVGQPLGPFAAFFNALSSILRVCRARAIQVTRRIPEAPNKQPLHSLYTSCRAPY